MVCRRQPLRCLCVAMKWPGKWNGKRKYIKKLSAMGMTTQRIKYGSRKPATADHSHWRRKKDLSTPMCAHVDRPVCACVDKYRLVHVYT